MDPFSALVWGHPARWPTQLSGPRSTVVRQAWWAVQLSGPPSPTTPPARQAVQPGLVGRPAQFVAQIGGLLTTIYDRHSEL